MTYRTFLLSLTAALMAASCAETTGTQREYADARDLCRSTAESGNTAPAQAKPSGSPAMGEEYKKQLLFAFKQCMKRQGWSVTGPDKDDFEATPVPTAAPMAVQVVPLAPPPPIDNNAEKRAAECAYARQAIYHSSNARALAKACDIECANQKKLAPNAPLPAACPQ